MASLNLLIITQQNGVANIAVSYFHKGLEVFVLDVFLKAVSRDFHAICTSIIGFSGCLLLLFCLFYKENETVKDCLGH